MCPGDKFHDLRVSGTNFGKAAADYGSFRAGFPDSFFDRLFELDIGLPGQRIVDFGTGTGTLARGFASRGCKVAGIDPDPRMLSEARKLDAQKNVSVRYVQATAENTGLDDLTADVVTAGQCWHWFDRSLATKEALRILTHDGKLVIAHFDWLPLAGNVVEATERLIEKHNPQWNLGGGRGIHPEWLPGLSEAGLRNIETFSYDIDSPYTPTAWRGRIRASAGVTALPPEEVRNFDNALAKMLSDQYPYEILNVPHRVFAIVASGA
jgi:SAM-dependent methyltransferase